MKRTFLYSLLLCGILLIPTISYAQKVTVEEDVNVKFQTAFFEALKQKAINNYKKAIENLEVCYEIDANNTAVEFEFSKNYFALKNYFEAMLFIDKALLKEPENNYLLKHKVLIYKSLKDYSSAIEVQKKIIKINPIYSDELVLLYLQNKEFDKASKLISEIEKKAMSSAKINSYKNYIANKNKVKKPKKNVKSNELVTLKTLKKKYKNTKKYSTLQELLNYEVKNSLFELLYEDSKNGLELFPTQPFLYRMNGLALNKLTKYNEAIVILTIGIDFVIENNELEADFYTQLANAFEGINNKNEALKYKQKAEKLRHEN